MKSKIILFLVTVLQMSCGQLEECGNIEHRADGLAYKDGEILNLKCAFYDENNGKTISSHEFKDGKFHGEWKFYYLNGEVETSGFFENGERVGEWFYYHNNGRVKANLNYLNGKPHGLWKTMDENGLIIVEEEWINGIKQLDSINNPFNNVKIDGYEVKPTIID
jgi:antitoxin component YwqK of YwqJK toxin-antitoxin module